MPRFLPRRRRWQAALAAGVVLLAVVVAGLVIYLSRPENVSHPNVQFTAPTTTVAAPTRPRRRVAADTFSWPFYGNDAQRTHAFSGPADLRPPLHTGWTYNGDGSLLEFPPSIYHQRMFVLDDSGSARAISVTTGKVLWTRQVGTLAAATPAVDGAAGLVVVPVLSDHGRSPGDGSIVALSMKSGRVIWSKPVPAGSESSPVISDGVVFYGDQAGNLVARSAHTGAQKWTYKASGAIKGGPALSQGVLYFGDYAGRAYGIRAATGKQVWAVSTDGAHLGLGSGQFYATPTVAYGRVYMGNTDGRVYSFGARNGTLAWATSTGGYVYSSAAVADPKGVGPTVYVGSYDENLYAFNARSGAIRWKHPAGQRISGSVTIINNVAYYSTLTTHLTVGVSVVSGRQLFQFNDGAFTPAVADDHAIFLIGFSRIYEELPGVASAHHRAGHRRSRHRHHAVTTKTKKAKTKKAKTTSKHHHRARHHAAAHHHRRRRRHAG